MIIYLNFFLSVILTVGSSGQAMAIDDQEGREVLASSEIISDDLSLPLKENPSSEHSLATPIEIDWRLLLDIEFELKYYEELGIELAAPVFTKEIEVLDGKEVYIKGFIIPLDDTGESLALSMAPYASCFFCGKGSPASVLSLYLKEKGKRYKIDTYRRFKGTLHLNSDDPNEFFYVLRDAEEG